MTPPLARGHWVFDLDGTLTVAAHDFDAIRAELGLPAGQPILESLADLPAPEAARLRERLDAIELEIARSARSADGADNLLASLAARGVRVGILTRNSRANALATLAACSLERWFAAEVIVDRVTTAPKPDPAGIHHLLALWGAPAADAVVVGDFLFDLLAGRGAGAATVYVDPSGAFPWAEHADLAVRGLGELHDRLLGLGRRGGGARRDRDGGRD
jgi:HAD superfamily hydrolase (TIGR01509 family)